MGNKTARFFLMHSRPGFEGAVIDTHIHGWLEKVCQTDLPKPDNSKVSKPGKVMVVHDRGVFPRFTVTRCGSRNMDSDADVASI